jgi:hypothetical protein
MSKLNLNKHHIDKKSLMRKNIAPKNDSSIPKHYDRFFNGYSSLKCKAK